MTIAPTTVEMTRLREDGNLDAQPPVSGGRELSSVVDSILTNVTRQLESRRWPGATYRVQFNRDFTFRQATACVAYWGALGITDCYTSPYLKACAGSRHGYDIVDHSVLNPELGTEADFRGFVAELRKHGMGHIQDFVPNHMGIASNDNLWFLDVLENGPSSQYASYFDIDWHPLKTDLEFKVLLPVLGSQFGRALEDQQLHLAFRGGAFHLHYYDRCFPIAPRSFEFILGHRLEELAGTLPSDDAHRLEYHSILTAISHLPHRHEVSPNRRDERSREKEVIKRRLQRLCTECPQIRDFIDSNVALINGQPGEPRSFDLLDQLLREQAYRLSSWRVAADEINYRRFFDVNELAALCMERPQVFEDTHRLVLQLLDAGHVDGMRIDHADGLYDPTAYLWQLQERRFLQLCRSEFEQGTEATGVQSANWPEIEIQLRQRFNELRAGPHPSPLLRSLYLVVEKILERTEELPDNWPVHGTTGYEFLNCVNGLFVDKNKIHDLDAVYARFVDRKLDFEEMVYEAKRLILKVSMSSELHVLGHQLDRISERNRWTRDFTRHGLIQALREVIACFPVYRTYISGRSVVTRDREYVEHAVAKAKQRNPAVSSEVFDFISSVLVHAGDDSISADEWAQRQEFVGRFQQFTGPMMAKSVEDTAFYRFHRLVSANEVGGDPQRITTSVAEFHRQNLERQRHRPRGMLTTSTHDTKRSEDVRARINVLSEVPAEWRKAVLRWTRWNQKAKQIVDAESAPSRDDEYLLYQTLVGTWPLLPLDQKTLSEYVKRIQDYMLKAVREAKLVSSWITPNERYERGLNSFIEAILSEGHRNRFRKELEEFAGRVSPVGLWNSLSQTLLKLTSPGVPDLYQGTELWDFSLVDPDNRRPVDYAIRMELLQRLTEQQSGENLNTQQFFRRLVTDARDGRIKLFTITQTLRERRLRPELYTEGEYIPLELLGQRRVHACAYARRLGDDLSITVVPRLIASLVHNWDEAPLGVNFWQDTRLVLPDEFSMIRLRNVFTGVLVPASNELLVGDLLADFPVCLIRNNR